MTGFYDALCPFLPVKSVFVSMLGCFSLFVVLYILWSLFSVEAISSSWLSGIVTVATKSLSYFGCNKALDV